ncbi:hypothetical protein [Stappia stellulata]|uniref:hypothetical protein n=1 Tax=Stappia stellulata TaxID=71235 RepID=UPI0012EC4A72|nr:hypothetical protein [Stappia stellulata]
MDAQELEDVFLSDEFNEIFGTQEDFDPKEVVDHENYLEIASSGVFPVRAISSMRDRSVTNVDVRHEDSRDLGQLLLLKGKVVENFYSLSSTEFLAYLADVPQQEFGEPGYTFSSDYLVTTDVPPAEYDQELRATSDIWGGFSHYVKPSNVSIAFESIIASSRILIPSEHHSEAFARYTFAQNPFERFLRLYQCVELLFDTITVLKIKKLNADIRDLSVILSAHGTKEVHRLVSISYDFIYDHERLAEKLTLVSGYEGLAKTIFDEHSKDGNPIPPSSNPPRWSSVINSLGAGHFNEHDLKVNNTLKSQEDYKSFISKLSAYWIYRVRCSIAHSRIGEFILTESEADFVRCFAEPLLLEFCSQVFSSQALKDIWQPEAASAS